MKQIEVKIMGQAYLLGAPEGGEERLQQAVQRVDAAMCKIRDAGKIKARDRIAVLAALNLAFELAEQPKAAAMSVIFPAQFETDRPPADGQPGDGDDRHDEGAHRGREEQPGCAERDRPSTCERSLC